MSIEVEMTGSGTIGNIVPGWNVQEFATPVAPGDNAGGTGTVSLSARATDDSLLINNNSITTTVPHLGSISGTVQNVSQSGMGVSLSHSNALAFYDSSKIIPPVSYGNPATALDLCSQISGVSRFQSSNSTARYWSLAGHNIGFQNPKQNTDGSWTSSQIPVVTDAMYVDTVFAGGVSVAESGAGNADYSGNYFYASSLVGFAIDQTKQNNISFKVKAGQSTQFSFYVTYLDYFYGYITDFYYATYSTTYNTLTAGYVYDYFNITGGSTVYSTTVSPSYFDNSKEYIFSVCSNIYNGSATNGSIGVTLEQDFAGVIITLAYASRTGITSGVPGGNYIGVFSVSSQLRSLIHSKSAYGTNTSISVGEYELVRPYNIDSSMNLPSMYPVPSVESNMWEYIQDACSATANEVCIIANPSSGVLPYIPTVRAVGSNVLDITNNVDPVNVTVSSSFSAKAVNVSYTDASTVQYAEIYNAYTEGDSVIEVKAGQITEVVLQTNASPTGLMQPVRRTSLPNSAGSYIISDANTLIVGGSGNATAWEDYGGSLTVSLSDTIPGGIVVRVVGPSIDIPSYPGPYKIAYVTGYETYAALSIIGSGVTVSPKTIELQSGANPNKTSKDKSSNIDNPFIATKAMAYDRGIWAAQKTAGPVVSISTSIPTNQIHYYYSGQNAGFGVTPGSIITYNKSKYRVTDCSIGNAGMSLNAVRHVDVSDFQSSWSSVSTVGTFDSANSGLDVQDLIVKPLYN